MDKIDTRVWDCERVEIYVCMWVFICVCFWQVHSFDIYPSAKKWFSSIHRRHWWLFPYTRIYLYLFVYMYSYSAGNGWQLGIYVERIRWICVSIWRHQGKLTNISFNLETLVLPMVHLIAMLLKKITLVLPLRQKSFNSEGINFKLRLRCQLND